MGGPFAPRAAAMPCCHVHALFLILDIIRSGWSQAVKMAVQVLAMCDYFHLNLSNGRICRVGCKSVILVPPLPSVIEASVGWQFLFAQFTADPSMFIFVFHSQLTADRGQAVPAINHTRLIQRFNEHVGLFWVRGPVSATEANISWHRKTKITMNSVLCTFRKKSSMTSADATLLVIIPSAIDPHSKS